MAMIKVSFDTFIQTSPVAGSSGRRPRGKALAHCSCDTAHKNYRIGGRKVHGITKYDLVPTASADGTHCDHCGYYVCWQEPLFPEPAKPTETSVSTARGLGRPVIGRNVDTGEEVSFPSAYL